MTGRESAVNIRARWSALGLAAVLAAAAATPTALASPKAAKPPKPKTVQVQILGLNDFHGALEPPSGSGGRIGVTNAGGAEYLATHVRDLRATNPNTLFVSAGDLIGATPLLSALFHDEPTIEAANLMHLDFNAVGNHEFDEGVYELQRMQYGGCHPVDGCQDGDGFAGADFDFLAANVKYKNRNQTIFPPYRIRSFGGVKVGLIGLTTKVTPTIVSPSGISMVDFLDEVETVNALVPKLRREGVRTIIVLLHEGGTTSNPLNETTINDCGTTTGRVPEIANALSDEVDVMITGHTNWAVNCVIDGKVVTGAGSNGRLITDIDMTLSKSSKQPTQILVNNRIVTRDVTPAADLTELITGYRDAAAPYANRVIGTITADILRTANAAGESALGDRIADAQNYDAQQAGTGSQITFMNAGGIRADLLYANSPGGEAPGEVTYGEAFAVQPFGNSLVTMSLTGAHIDALLEQQFTGGNGTLQVSEGFSYEVSASAAAGSKIDNITLDGVALDPSATYRVTCNSFLADGGDNYTVFTQGTNRVPGNVDTDAFENYLQANPGGITPGPQDRIVAVP